VKLREASHRIDCSAMNNPTHEFVTVDMRGLKAALVERANADRVSVSVLVRAAVARELGIAEPSVRPGTSGSDTVKLSIRMSRVEAGLLANAATASGLSRGAYLAGLVAGIPALSSSANRTDHLASLMASSAELSTLSRNINHLTSLLRQGAGRAAQEYREMLDTLGDDIRGHLKLASATLADLQPRNCSQAPRRAIP
jgi:hypothetical protein